jgi:hypothetical protein
LEYLFFSKYLIFSKRKLVPIATKIKTGGIVPIVLKAWGIPS